MPFINEAVHALAEGIADAEGIDTVAKLGFGHPMGPLALADLIGLDTCVAIMEVLHAGLGDPRFEPAPLLREHVAAGRLGPQDRRGLLTLVLDQANHPNGVGRPAYLARYAFLGKERGRRGAAAAGRRRSRLAGADPGDVRGCRGRDRRALTRQCGARVVSRAGAAGRDRARRAAARRVRPRPLPGAEGRSRATAAIPIVLLSGSIELAPAAGRRGRRRRLPAEALQPAAARRPSSSGSRRGPELDPARRGAARREPTTAQLLLYARDLRRIVELERAQRRLLQEAYGATVGALAEALASEGHRHPRALEPGAALRARADARRRARARRRRQRRVRLRPPRRRQDRDLRPRSCESRVAHARRSGA